MQLKQEFIRTCNQLGLEDCEVSLAEVIWQRAERAAWGLSKQVPSLLDNKEQTIKQVIDEKPISLEINMLESESEANNELTQSDLQVLNRVLASLIRKYQQSCNHDKTVVKILWNKCEPDNPESAYDFEALNFCKDVLRKNKKKRDKLAAVQHKIKKLCSIIGE